MLAIPETFKNLSPPVTRNEMSLCSGCGYILRVAILLMTGTDQSWLVLDNFSLSHAVVILILSEIPW